MMKKIFSILIMSILLISLCGNVLAADTYTATSTINGVTVNWEYELNDANQIKNLRCTNPNDLNGNIKVPATLDGKTIIEIGTNAFEGANITGVTIPDSVEKICRNAFKDCANLASVNLGKIKEFAGNGIFTNCTSLKNIVIPKTLTEGYTYFEGAFSGCTSLTSVKFEDGITKIPEGILMDATTITTVSIPSSVTEIGNNAFAKSGLTEITIPNNVTQIGISAFESTKLTEIQIPNSVKEIGVFAFKNCSNLVKATIPSSVEKMGYYDTPTDRDDIFTNHNDNLIIYCDENSDAAEYAIKNNIKYIYSMATEKKPNIAIIIAGVLLVLIIIGVFIYFKSRKSKNKEQSV